MNITLGTQIPWLLTSLLALLPLCWMKVAKVGNATLRPTHLVLIVLGGLLIPKILKSGIKILQVRQFRIFVLVYSAYLAIVMLGLLRPESNGRSFATVIKLVTYFGFFCLLAELLARLPPRRIALAVYLGSTIGTLAFLFVAIYIFARRGRNLPVEYLSAVGTADFLQLRCSFYPVLFNYSGEKIVVKGQEELISASFRHGLLSCFFCFSLLVRALRPLADDVFGRPIARLIQDFVFGASVFLIVTSVSRSIIFALVAAVMTTSLLMVVTRELRPPSTISICVLLLILAAMTLALGLNPSVTTALADGFQTRFLELQNNPRVSMFAQTLRESSSAWLFGHGIGATISQRDQQVHNVVLGGLYEGGLATMCAAFIFYAALMYTWIGSCIYYIKQFADSTSSIRWPWLLAIPVLPLLTAMVSGASGNFTLNDWVCLAFYFGCLGVL